VKIGGIAAWSGVAGMMGAMVDVCIDLVEYQVNEVGEGILGGRELEVVKCDMRSTTSGAVACARQLLYEDEVAALLWGGQGAAEAIAISEFAEEHEIPYFFIGGMPIDIADQKFTVRTTLSFENLMQTADDTVKLINPNTVACLALDTTDGRAFMGGWIDRFEAAGVEVLYEEYHPVGTTDFTPYLTRIKHLNPDLLMLQATIEGYTYIAKQIVGLGGLDDMQVMCDPPAEASQSELGAQGWYIRTFWYPGLPYPGNEKYEEDYYAIYKVKPSISFAVYFYNSLWTAIHAIELAGTDTDRVKIAEAARSGKLEWETPIGLYHITPGGEPGSLPTRYVQIQERRLVPIEIPE
jgi:branched-chain amino acid transport system substrate-binding protein